MHSLFNRVNIYFIHIGAKKIEPIRCGKFLLLSTPRAYSMQWEKHRDHKRFIIGWALGQMETRMIAHERLAQNWCDSLKSESIRQAHISNGALLPPLRLFIFHLIRTSPLNSISLAIR